jgi:GH35 family endo-1,4-beta-xylanase
VRWPAEVRRRFLDLARTLQRRRVPLHALGLQVHEPLDAWFPPTELRLTLDECAALSLPRHLTEFIPLSSGRPITGGWREGTWSDGTSHAFTVVLSKKAGTDGRLRLTVRP